MPSSADPVLPPHYTTPFDDEIGLVFTELGPDGARAQLEVQPKLWQPTGIVVGVNNNTDFLRAVSSGTVDAMSTPIHRGRRQQLWLVTITDSAERMVARGQVRLQNLETPD